MPDNTADTETNPFTLPAGFEHLAKFREWSLATETERVERRVTLPYDQIESFYNEYLTELPPVLRYLGTRTVEESTREDARLLHMTFSFFEAADAVEIYEQGPVVDGDDIRNFLNEFKSNLTKDTMG
jgi:hypothetical protein